MANGSLPGIHVDFSPFAHQTCMDVQEGFLYIQSDYDRSMRPAGSCDIMLGRKLGTGCQLKYSDELLMSNMDTVNLLQHRIETMAGGFIPTSYQECSLLKQTSVLTPIAHYRALLQKGKTAKITAGSHEIIPKTGGNITSMCNARMILSMQPSYDRSRRPAGINGIMLGRKMGKGCQLKYADPPMSKRLTINKFVEADKTALMTCDRDTTIRMHSFFQPNNFRSVNTFLRNSTLRNT